MQVYHIGAPDIIVADLVNELRALEVEASVVDGSILGQDLKKTITSCDFARNAILHIHLAELPQDQPTIAALAKLRSNGLKIIVQAYADSLSPTDKLISPPPELLATVDQLLISSAALALKLNNGISWRWLQIPLVKMHDCEPRELVKGDHIQVLAISGTDAYNKLINSIVHRLESKGLSIDIQWHDLTSLDALYEGVKSAHILIDRLDGDCYRFPALLGMAAGCACISSLSKEATAAWELLKFSQIVTANCENVENKLDDIIREPRSIRDFGKRGQAFIAQYHDPFQIAQILASKYKTLAQLK